MLKRTRVVAVAVAALLAGLPGAATAQLDNKPYQFRGGASAGMSNAGRQAILRQKVFGETPRDLVRGPGDRLLSVQEGPGGTPVVSDQGGEVLPGFRGRSAFRRDTGMGVGVFNAFFRPVSRDRGAWAFFAGGAATRIGIAGWTTQVSGGGGVVPTGYSPVDSWTTQVFLYFAE